MGNRIRAAEISSFVAANYRFSLWQMPGNQTLFQKRDMDTGELADKRVYPATSRDLAADDFAILKAGLLPDNEALVVVELDEFKREVAPYELL